MTDWYPGAIKRPIDYSNHPACGELTAFTVHEAVTTAEQSVFGWVSSEGSCNVFNGKHGYTEQYIPAGVQSYANSDGNHRSFAMESYDGLQPHTDASGNYSEIPTGGIYGDSAQTGRWDDGQCERIADIFAWLNLDHGIPLRLMATSHTSEHGIGPHRLGVPGWPTYDQNGGELWTSHRGKPCPGDLRIAQLPGIVARAQQIASAIQAGASYLPPGNVDLTSALSRGTIIAPTPPAEKDWFDMATLDDLKTALKDPSVLDAIASAVLNKSYNTDGSGHSTTLARGFGVMQNDVHDILTKVNTTQNTVADIKNGKGA